MDILSSTKIEVTETLFGKKETKFNSVLWVERSVFIDGELHYKEVIKPETDRYSKSVLKNFICWLFGQKEGCNGCHISKDCSKGFCLFRKGLFQAVNFKLQFFKACLYQNFFCCKSTKPVKVKSIKS